MKSTQLNVKWLPELYFILVSALWYHYSVQNSGSVSGYVVNFPALMFIVLFHIQLFMNDQVLGRVLALATGAASVYLLYTLAVNLSLSRNFTEQSSMLLLKDGNFILLNFIMAYWMFSNYRNKPVQADALHLLTEKIQD